MKYEANRRVPFMRLFFLDHLHRTSRLTLEQRGFLDVVRGELWSVNGVRMLRADLFTRLQIKDGNKHHRLFSALIDLGLLDLDADEMVSDSVLTGEWDYALQRSDKNRANASKPRKKTSETQTTTTTAPDPDDF